MKRTLSIFLVCALVVVLFAGMAMAGKPAMANVIIGFKGAPNAELVRSFGGTVNHTYGVIPAVAASVPETAVGALKNNPNVAYVEGDLVATICAQTLPWGVNRIDADVVHSGGNKGSGIKVCVVDTGVDVDHPDLYYRGGYDYVNNDSNPNDDHGHGTHVSGTVAALDNTTGVIGVAPSAYLYACKVLDSAGSGAYSDIIAGIDWARNNGMDIINMSLGGSSGTTSLQNACDNAYSAGVLVVAAAGNSGNWFGWGDTVGYPAKYDSVIAVAATNSSDGRPYWSSHGPAVEVAAPGVDVYSCAMGGGYTTMSGTSMASPHCAGHGALIWYAHPSWSNASVRSRIDSAVIDLGASGWDKYYGYGLIYSPWGVQ